MTITIRRYHDGDLGACRALWVELTGWHREIYRNPRLGGPDPGQQFNELLTTAGPDHIWVAEMDGRVVGMAGLILRHDEAELEPIVVSDGFRDLGIGRRLAQAVISAAREAGVRQLLTRPVARNALAIQFFHALGFDVLGQLELVMDLRPPDDQDWRPGEHLAGRPFRV